MIAAASVIESDNIIHWVCYARHEEIFHGALHVYNWYEPVMRELFYRSLCLFHWNEMCLRVTHYQRYLIALCDAVKLIKFH